MAYRSRRPRGAARSISLVVPAMLAPPRGGMRAGVASAAARPQDNQALACERQHSGTGPSRCQRAVAGRGPDVHDRDGGYAGEVVRVDLLRDTDLDRTVV